MTILGVDLSHHQQPTDFNQVKASGRDFVYLKATEGIGYVDPAFATFRQQAHAAGLIVGIYHFARDNDPVAEFAYFAGVVGALQPGEFLVLDQEVTHATGNAVWCKAWLDAAKAHYGIAPMIYMNQGSSTGVTSAVWSTIAQTYGLILARYDNAPDVLTTVLYWGTPAMKQFYDQGSVPGVPGPCDVDSFFGSTQQLLAYGYNPAPPMEDDVSYLQWPAADKAQLVSDVVTAVWQSQGDAGHGQGVWIADRIIGIDGKTGDLAVTAQQARDAATGANTRAGEIETILNTQVLPALAQAAPTIDETKLAAALLADPASVDALGKAIASHLKLASG